MATTKITGNLINDLPNSGVATADLADGVLSADTTGRAKMADGFVSTAKIVAGAADHTIVAAGSVVQVVNTQTGAVATGTTVLPSDDSIPQNTEGDQYMSLAITPKSATNKLKIDIVIVMASSAAGTSVMTAALFQDSTVSALAALSQVGSSNGQTHIGFTHWMTAGTTSATTFKVRGGGSAAGTTTFNGHSGGRHMGGVMASSITITEIKA